MAATLEKPRFRSFKPAGGLPASVWQRLQLPASGGARLIEEIRQGLPVAVVGALRDEIGETLEQLLHLIDLSSRTLARRQAEGHLKPDESDRVVRLINVIAAAESLFEGDRDAVRRWLRQPAAGLGGRTPLEIADTEVGARELLNLIGRLEHGVFS